MSLTDLPTIKPSETTIFFMAVLIISFIFFFTQPKASDVALISESTVHI
ncbi:MULTISPECIES: hypothetical protein [Bacillaceae]|uniref:Uncharacterized protein n=1 Tax=Ectobacillus funiculus TaxID=137993 RepID=A0ABV5WM54_9BACI|nr:hypothetical protein [Ectobacillus funiculus]